MPVNARSAVVVEAPKPPTLIGNLIVCVLAGVLVHVIVTHVKI